MIKENGDHALREMSMPNVVGSGGQQQLPIQSSSQMMYCQDPEVLLRQAHESYRLGNYIVALQNCQPVI